MPHLQQQDPDKGAPDTALENFPLFCPKCKRETVISLIGQKEALEMKIYDKSSFAAGIICACALVLFAFDILEAGWPQWLIAIAFSAKFLYIGLSKKGSERNRFLSENYKDAAIALLGKAYWIKTNLPLVVFFAFAIIALILRYGFQIYTPVWAGVVFVIVLAIAAAYSLGKNREITAYIDASKADSRTEPCDK